MSPFCKHLSMPFQDSTQQRSDFSTSCTKPFMISFRPLFPASSSSWAYSLLIHKAHVQPDDSQFLEYVATSYLCLLPTLPFLLRLPSPGASARWLFLTLGTSSQAQPHLWSWPWLLHSSFDRWPYLKYVAMVHFSHCHRAYIKAQWPALITHPLIFPDSSHRHPQYGNCDSHRAKRMLSKYFLYE